MFDIDPGNNVILKDPALLLTQEFKVLWDSDKSKEKSEAYKDFAYIYFKNDFKSPYRNSFTKQEIESILIQDLQLGKGWKPSEALLNAETKYNELQTSKTLKVLASAETALEQVILYFNSFNIATIEEDRKADAISKLMNNVKSIDEVVAKLSAAKERVEKELQTKKLSGTKQLSSRELPKSKRR